MKVIVLKEGSRPNEIGYHFTSLQNFAQIINSNALIATNPAVVQGAHGWSVNDEGKKSWSYTRKKDGMYYRNMNKPDAVRLTLDIDGISNNHKVFPFSWQNYHKDDANFEFEDRVVGQTWIDSSGEKVTGTKNITKYIKEISLSSLLEPDVILYTFSAKMKKDVDSLDSNFFDYIEREFKQIEKLNSDSEELETVLKSKTELKEYLKKGLKEHDYNLQEYSETLSKMLNGRPKYNEIKTILSDIVYSLREFEKDSIKIYNRLTKLTKRSFSISDTALKDIHNKFYDMLGELDDFDIAKVKGKDKTFEYRMQIFEDYLKNKGIKLSFQKYNGSYLNLRDISSGVRADNLPKMIQAIKKYALDSLDKFEQLKKRCSEFSDYLETIDYSFPSLPEEIVTILDEVVSESNEEQVDKVFTTIKQSTSECSVYARTGRFGQTGEIMFVFGKNQEDTVAKLNKKIPYARRWKLAAEEDISTLKRWYKFTDETVELLRGTNYNGKSVKGTLLKKQIKKLLKNNQSSFEECYILIDDKNTINMTIQNKAGGYLNKLYVTVATYFNVF